VFQSGCSSGVSLGRLGGRAFGDKTSEKLMGSLGNVSRHSFIIPGAWKSNRWKYSMFLVQLNQLNDVEGYNGSELEGLSHLFRSSVSVQHFLGCGSDWGILCDDVAFVVRTRSGRGAFVGRSRS